MRQLKERMTLPFSGRKERINLSRRKSVPLPADRTLFQALRYYWALFFLAIISLMMRCATSETEMPRFMLVTCIFRCASSSEMP